MLSADDCAAWRTAANSIALGVELVAHLEPILAPEAMLVGFCCDSEDLAGVFVERIEAENVGAECAAVHPGSAGQTRACDVVLPCAPGFTAEEIDHVVLAAVKASHGIMCPSLIRRESVP
jgi:hypothetical protein